VQMLSVVFFFDKWVTQDIVTVAYERKRSSISILFDPGENIFRAKGWADMTDKQEAGGEDRPVLLVSNSCPLS